MMAPPRKPIAERLAVNTAPNGDCTDWTGVIDKHGYGKMVIGRKEYRAHRVSYMHHHGLSELPSSVFICHTCDRRSCVNPTHLFAGDAYINTRDMIEKGRKARLVDADHPNTKIAHSDRKVIRELRSSGLTLKAIAARFGVSFQTVSDICRGARCYGAA